MSVTITYDWDNGQADALFKYAGYRSRSLRDPLQRAATKLLHHINLTFESEGAWIGDPWPRLSSSYAPWKEEHYPGRQIGVATGDLRSRAISRDAIRVTEDQVTYHVDGVKAAAFQSGWSNSRGSGPPRPFAEATPELLADIREEFRAWADELKGMNSARGDLDLINPL